jgi:hypothetical protein
MTSTDPKGTAPTHPDQPTDCCDPESDCCGDAACACEAEGGGDAHECCGQCGAEWEPCPQCGAEGECEHYNAVGEPVTTDAEMIECGVDDQNRALFLSVGFSLADIERISRIRFNDDGTAEVDPEVAADDPRVVDVLHLLAHALSDKA